ncbi:uncharacterized protein LOC144601366 [Rhinoraja longicauda]
MALRTKPQKHKSSDSSDILGAISPANQYLVRLIEDKKELSFKKPTEDRMNMVFQVLEDLLPELGIYASVLKLIRDELYDGVYSSQLTVNSGSESGITDVATRAPYFSLLQCLQEKRAVTVAQRESCYLTANAALEMQGSILTTVLSVWSLYILPVICVGFL